MSSAKYSFGQSFHKYVEMTQKVVRKPYKINILVTLERKPDVSRVGDLRNHSAARRVHRQLNFRSGNVNIDNRRGKERMDNETNVQK
jgi:hypothetical protein